MIICSFDVLAETAPSIALRQPREVGIKLYNTLLEDALGLMTVTFNSQYTPEEVEHWTKLYNVKVPATFFHWSQDPKSKAVEIDRLMAVGGRRNWYVDTDPAAIAATLSQGIPSLLVGIPFVVRPEWHSNPGPRQWADIAKEVERQAILKANRDTQRDHVA